LSLIADIHTWFSLASLIYCFLNLRILFITFITLFYILFHFIYRVRGKGATCFVYRESIIAARVTSGMELGDVPCLPYSLNYGHYGVKTAPVVATPSNTPTARLLYLQKLDQQFINIFALFSAITSETSYSLPCFPIIYHFSFYTALLLVHICVTA